MQKQQKNNLTQLAQMFQKTVLGTPYKNLTIQLNEELSDRQLLE